jgi:hypothetical protein
MWLASCFPAAQAIEPQVSGAPALAWVELRPMATAPELIEIVSHAQGIGTASGRYTLEVWRSGAGGALNNRQEGQFQIVPGETVTLSRTTINFPKGSRIEAVLTLHMDGQPITSATIKGGS